MRIRIGDTVAFRRHIVSKCEALAQLRATVTNIAGEWVFMTEADGREKVMPAAHLCRVAPNGLVLELV